jgi:hypothetical protein
MEDQMRRGQKFPACLENPEFARAIRRPETEADFDPRKINRIGENGTSTAGSETGSRGRAIAQALMKVHPCSTCPIRRLAGERPGSLFARAHHWHRSWWPGWKIYTAESAGGDTSRRESPDPVEGGN